MSLLVSRVRRGIVQFQRWQFAPFVRELEAPHPLPEWLEVGAVTVLPGRVLVTGRVKHG